MAINRSNHERPMCACCYDSSLGLASRLRSARTSSAIFALGTSRCEQ